MLDIGKSRAFRHECPCIMGLIFEFYWGFRDFHIAKFLGNIQTSTSWRFFPWVFLTISWPFVLPSGWKAQCGGCAAPLGFSCQRSWILFRASPPSVRSSDEADTNLAPQKDTAKVCQSAVNVFFLLLIVVNVNVFLSMLSHDWTKLT